MYTIRQILGLGLIALTFLCCVCSNQAHATTSEQYYRDVIKQSQTVVIASYVQGPNGVKLQIKYGWGAPVQSLEQVSGAGFIDTREDQLIFIANSNGSGFVLVDQIPYSEAQIPYKLLGSPEWGVTPDGGIAYYTKPQKK